MNGSYARVFAWLVWRNVRILRNDFLNNLVDALIVPSTFIIIGGYVLPHMGMPANYGAFMMASTMVLMCYSTTSWRGSTKLITDLDGDRAILYELTLPLPSWLIFIKYSLSYAIDAMFLNILTIPMGKLLLGSQFVLAKFSIIKFILIYMTVNIFFGAFSVWIASWVPDMQGFTRFWLRFGSQMLFYSGYQFPWHVLNSSLEVFSYINLLNPFVYAFEGVRGAVLGQEGSLNFWVCLAVLWLYYIGFTVTSIKLFRKKLDYV